jgi:NADH-quinone oxidoreductase subunit G
VLANQLAISGFDYVSALQIKQELQEIIDLAPQIATKNFYPQALPAKEKHHFLTRITEWPIYAIDSIVRRSKALQDAASNDPVAVYMNQNLADRLLITENKMVNVVQGEGRTRLPVIVSSRIPDNCVLVHAGREQTVALGSAFGAIEVYV